MPRSPTVMASRSRSCCQPVNTGNEGTTRVAAACAGDGTAGVRRREVAGR